MEYLELHHLRYFLDQPLCFIIQKRQTIIRRINLGNRQRKGLMQGKLFEMSTSMNPDFSRVNILMTPLTMVRYAQLIKRMLFLKVGDNLLNITTAFTGKVTYRARESLPNFVYKKSQCKSRRRFIIIGSTLPIMKQTLVFR